MLISNKSATRKWRSTMKRNILNIGLVILKEVKI